eukprot:gene14692-14849_t
MADQQTAVVQLLAQVGGTNRLLEVPSPIGKDPDMLQLCCSRDPQVLEMRMARLKLSGCSQQLVADRLDSMMVSSISCSLDSPDALMACSQAAVARIYKSVTDTSGATRMQYQDATIGLQYIAARAVTQQLTGLSQCRLSQRRFIMANLYMLHIRNKEFDQAQLLDIMGDEELLPFQALARALQRKQYYSALSLARDCANPIMHLHLSTIDVVNWRQQVVHEGPPDTDQCQVSMSQAVINLGFYQPAPLLRQETESSAVEELNRFHDRYASRSMTIGKARKLTPGGPATKVVLFKVKASRKTSGAATDKTDTGTGLFGTAHVGEDVAGRSTAGASGSRCTLSQPQAAASRFQAPLLTVSDTMKDKRT